MDDFKKFICHACGYIYDEALGDANGGLPPGTRYEDIPDDWMCPVCGVNKFDFSPYESKVTRQPKAALTYRGETRHIRLRAGPKPVVIAGGGMAAWAAASALRHIDKDLPLVMVSACSAGVYHKPLLSVACAQNKSAQQVITSSGPAMAAQLNIKLLNNTWITGIDRLRQRVRTTRGAIVYENLVLATGASPSPLPLDAESLKHIWRVNHLDDYSALRARLGADKDTPKRIVIIGAGLVGCELADDLAVAGHHCILLESAAQPLMGLAPPDTAVALVQALAKAGIEFHANARVTDVRRSATGFGVNCMKNAFQADLVLAATGLRTDTRLALSAGLGFDNGYAVEKATMRTSDANIFALGDCASFGGKAYRFIEPIYRQAEVIAAEISGIATSGFEMRAIPVRLKSRSMPLTLRFAA